MILSQIFAGNFHFMPSWPSGLLAWAAAALLVPQLKKSQLLQIGSLLLVGTIALLSGAMLGETPPWLNVLDTNSGLLSMLAAVSFLRLIAMKKEPEAGQVPHGLSAFRHTMLAVAIFGSCINISAPTIIADRLAEKNALSTFASQSIIKTFSGCAAWSPFFAGMAVVLTYIADARLPFIMIFGFPLAVLGFLLIVIEARIRFKTQLDDFEGYPITITSLWVPSLLALSVLLGHFTLPHASILVIIAMAALLVSAVGLCFSDGCVGAFYALQAHITRGLPRMVGELLLFLSAGVLAVGLRTIVSATHISLPFAGVFGASEAGVLLISMVLIAILGLHPIISIAVFTPLLAPLKPDPQLLAITYIFAWSLGTCAGPLSGINLIFQGRYGISALQVAMRNWPFVAIMTLAGLALLHGAAMMRGIQVTGN
jgi:hypothetical protein